MSKFNTLIAGLGGIGFEYDFNSPKSITHYSTIKKFKEFAICAGIDINSKKRLNFELNTGIKAFDVSGIGKIKTHIDIIIICVSTTYHYEITNTLLKQFRPKVIIIEKPFGNCIKQATEIVEHCNSRGILLFVNYNRSFYPFNYKIQNLFDKTTFFNGVVYYSNGFFNNGSHFIDLLRNWLGIPKMIRITKNYGASETKSGDFELDVDFEYEKGIIQFISWPEKYYSNYSIDIKTNYFSIKSKNNVSGLDIFMTEKDPEYDGFLRLSQVPRFNYLYLDGLIPLYTEVLRKIHLSSPEICQNNAVSIETLKILDQFRNNA